MGHIGGIDSKGDCGIAMKDIRNSKTGKLKGIKNHGILQKIVD